VTDAAGRKQIALGAGPDRHGIAVFDSNEAVRAAIAMGPQGPLSCVSDEKGAPRAGMSLAGDGAYIVSTVDAAGVERVLD
jgi:hypothetical protein